MTNNPTVTAIESSGTTDIAFSQDQTKLYVAKSSGNIDVFDVATQQKLATWHIATGPLGGLSISPDGKSLVAIVQNPPVAYQISTVDGTVLASHAGANNPFSDAQLVDAGTVLLIGETKPSLSDFTTYPTTALNNAVDGGSPTAIATHSGNLTLLGETGVSNGPLAIYDQREHRIVAAGNASQADHSGFNFGAQAASEAAGAVYQFIYPNYLNIYDLTLRKQGSVTLQDRLSGLAIDRSGAFAYGITDGAILKYDTSTWTVISRLQTSLPETISAANFGNSIILSDDGQHLAVYSAQPDASAVPPYGSAAIVSLGSTVSGGSTTLAITGIGDTITNIGNLTGSPAVRVSANHAQFINAGSGRILGSATGPSIVLTGVGDEVSNLAGATIAAGSDQIAILGSANADTVYNAGSINGLVSLGGGADTVVNEGSGTLSLDLGDGDDIYRVLGTTGPSLRADGGAGTDTLVLDNSSYQIFGGALANFERLVVQASGNYNDFSGYQSITLQLGSSFNFINSANPGVEITLAGQGLRLSNSSLRAITGASLSDQIAGSALLQVSDTVELSNGASVAGAIKLGDGADTLQIDLVGDMVPPTFGQADGGDGSDTLAIYAPRGTVASYDVGNATGFEKLDVDAGYANSVDISLSHATGMTTVVIGSTDHLTLNASNLSAAYVSGGENGGLTIGAGSTIQGYGPRTGPGFTPWAQSSDSDPALSVVVTNSGHILGDVAFVTGDDVYDGRGGTIDGVVYGNGGNDVMIGGSGGDRLHGDAGDDVLEGRDGQDVLDGGAGNDVLTGGAGADSLTGGGGRDEFRDDLANFAGDTITDLIIGDRIKLRDVAASDLTYSRGDGTLTLTGPNGSATIAIGTSAIDFQLSSESDGAVLTAVTKEPAPADFDGDGMSGILWQNSDGAISSWEVAGSQLHQNTYFSPVAPSWHAIETFDMTGDRRADILWRNDNGGVSVWTSGAGGFRQGAFNASVGTEWRVVGTGDINGDDRDDIVWQRSDGAVAGWTSNGTAFDQAAYYHAPVGGGWQIEGLGDFNGDGRADILWRDASGAVSTWNANGSGFTENAYFRGNVDAGWQIAGIGDFNDDGKSDILWHNSSGAVSVWLANVNGGFTENQMNASAPTSWQIAQVGDYNGDGAADILWHNANGAISIWSSSGTGFAQNSLYDAGAATSWHIAGHAFG